MIEDTAAAVQTMNLTSEVAPPTPQQSPIRGNGISRQASHVSVHNDNDYEVNDDNDNDMDVDTDADTAMPGSFTTPGKPSASNHPGNLPTPISNPRVRQPEFFGSMPTLLSHPRVRQPGLKSSAASVSPPSPTPSRTKSAVLSSGSFGRRDVSRSGSFAVPREFTYAQTGPWDDELNDLRGKNAVLAEQVETAN